VRWALDRIAEGGGRNQTGPGQAEQSSPANTR